jgi:ATP-dependent DNA helicase PIF1
VKELGGVEPYSFLSRTQITLVAGWTMTVLKSQGVALNRVMVNLSKSFEEGQLYVALFLGSESPRAQC